VVNSKILIVSGAHIRMIFQNLVTNNIFVFSIIRTAQGPQNTASNFGQDFSHRYYASHSTLNFVSHNALMESDL